MAQHTQYKSLMTFDPSYVARFLDLSRTSLPLIAVVGPTASGKTSRAVAMARMLNAEIISADSRQVYRGMDIGTGKDMDEYGDIPVHLIDIRPAGYKYNLHEFLQDYYNAENDIRSRGKNVILCGGTGLYAEAVLSGMKLPEVPVNKALRDKLYGKTLSELTEILSCMKTLHNTTDVDSCARAIRAIEIQQYYLDYPEETQYTKCDLDNRPESVIFLVDITREERRKKISQRLRARLDEGMIDEVRNLIASGIHPDDLIYYGLEYKFVTKHILGELSKEQMVSQLETAIHQFAKRQMTWYRGMTRRGFNLIPLH